MMSKGDTVHRKSPVGKGWIARLFGNQTRGPYMNLHTVLNLGLYSVEYKVETDGNVLRSNNRVFTQEASHTILSARIASYEDRVEVLNGDINEDGIITSPDARVIVNGREIERYTGAPIDLKDHGGMAFARAYMNRGDSGRLQPK